MAQDTALTERELAVLALLRDNAGTRFYERRIRALTLGSQNNTIDALKSLCKRGMIKRSGGSEPAYWCEPLAQLPPTPDHLKPRKYQR